MSLVFVFVFIYLYVLIGLRFLIRPYYQPRKSYDEFLHNGYKRRKNYNGYKRRKNYNGSQQMTPASELDNAYRTLGVKPSWSLKKITIRYKDLMRSNHPDRLNLHRNSAGAVNCSQYNAAIAIIRSQRS